MRHDILVGENRKLKLVLSCIFLFSSLSTSFAGPLPKNEALKQIKKNTSDNVVVGVCYVGNSDCNGYHDINSTIVKKMAEMNLANIDHCNLDSSDYIVNFTEAASKYVSDDNAGLMSCMLSPRRSKLIHVGKIDKINITGIRSSGSGAEVEYEIVLKKDSPFLNVFLKENKLKGMADFNKYDDGWRYNKTYITSQGFYFGNK